MAASSGRYSRVERPILKLDIFKMFGKAGFILLLITVFLGVWARASATDIKSFGVPYVQNYSKALYQSGNQNWAIAKDKRGVMYFANSEGLLAFDGRYWQQYQMPNRLIVRAVAADDKGRVFVGGFGEFGYWQYNKSGKLSYVSLIKLLAQKDVPKDEVWKIYADGERVLFQTFSAIYIYEKGKFRVVKSDQPFFFLHRVRNRYFVEVISKGLYELKGNTLSLVGGSNSAGISGILSILPYKKDQYLIGTEKNGLFIYDGLTFTPWTNQGDNFLKSFQLNNGVVVMDRYFAFGTILNGIIIIDENGKIIQRINKSSGLQNNTVLSIYTDNERNLWTGLDNGIDRIELNSPLYFYFDKSGDLGTVYSSIIHQNRIYLGTNQGLFYSNLGAMDVKGFQDFDFRLIPNSQGQVWDLSLIDGQLLCGHNNGTFSINGTTLQRLSAVNGGWVIKRLTQNKSLLIQGTYTGLVIYRKDMQGRWVFSHKVEGFGEPARYVEQDARGQIWVAHAYKGLYKLKLSSDLKKVVNSKYYGGTHGLPGSYNINVFNFENRTIFSSDSGFYLYDDVIDRFQRYQHLNNLLGSFSRSNRIIAAAENKYWFINHGRVALASLGEAGKVSVDSGNFTILSNRMVQYYENISRIEPSVYLISIDDGFAIFNAGRSSAADKNRPFPKVLIRRVENITEGSDIITESSTDAFEIEYKKNNIRISYALPYYRHARIQYQYLLEGDSDGWSVWSMQASKEFTNLPWGSYKFRVRASINGKIVSTSEALEFEVLPPWYLSRWAIAFYVILHVAAFLLLRRLYFANIRRHQEKIQEQLQKEKEEQLRQEAIATEQRIVRLRNEQLQSDLAGKSRELANSAMNIVYKNELLQKIREEIAALKDSSGKRLGDDQLKRIQKVIDEGLNDERDWNLFEKSFNEAHENFFKKLKVKHPELVPNDLKLCAYLRMNMSSKEIASLLNISVRGVEIRRYRLRKKLNLEHDKNLTEFFMQM